MRDLIEEKLLDKNGNPSRLKKKKHSDLCFSIQEQFPHEDLNTSIWLALGNEIRYCQKCNKALSISNFKIGYKETQKWCSIECRDSDETYKKYFTNQLKKIDYQARTKKTRQTVFERYGVYSVNDVPEIKSKMLAAKPEAIKKMLESNKKTCLERYGVPTYFSSEEFKNRVIPRKSLVQTELESFIQSLGFNVGTDRKILDGYEIDIFVEGKNIGFEVNGVYWHSSWDKESDKVSRLRHLNKTLKAKSKDVRLVHFTDVEIINKRQIVESMIRSILGRCENKIHARKCKISIVSNHEARDFLDENHIQGWAPCYPFYGLYDKGVLVSVMGFTKSRFDKSHDWELVRFASKLNTTVVGGFSKLLKHFRKCYKGSIVSYADFSRSNGNVYIQNDFEEISISKPSYRWVDLNKFLLINRHSTMKRNLPDLLGELYDSNLTESENMWRSGKYRKLWDCGQIKFVLK